MFMTKAITISFCWPTASINFFSIFLLSQMNTDGANAHILYCLAVSHISLSAHFYIFSILLYQNLFSPFYHSDKSYGKRWTIISHHSTLEIMRMHPPHYLHFRFSKCCHINCSYLIRKCFYSIIFIFCHNCAITLIYLPKLRSNLCRHVSA